MLTTLADLALAYLQSYVPSHSGPVPTQLQTPDDLTDSSISLFMVVPNQFPSDSAWTDGALFFCLRLSAARVITRRPSGGHQG